MMFAILFFCNNGYAQKDSIDIFNISLEELKNLRIITASMNEQKISEAPATIMVITKDIIKKRGYENLDDVLRDLPGIDIQRLNGWYGTLFAQRGIFGDENKRTVLMVNGVVENQMWGEEVHTGTIVPLFNVERIEILWGPSSALYGANAFNGIINIITLNKDINDYTSVSMGMGSFNTYMSRFAIKQKVYDKTSLSLTGNNLNSDGPIFKNSHPNYKNSYTDNAVYYSLNLNNNNTDLSVSYYNVSQGLGNSQVPVYEYMFKVQGINVPVEKRQLGANNSFNSEIFNEPGTKVAFQGTTISLKHNILSSENSKTILQCYYKIGELTPNHYDYVYKIRTHQNATNPSLLDTSYFDKINSWHISDGEGIELRTMVNFFNSVNTLGIQLDNTNTQIDYTKKTSSTFLGVPQVIEQPNDVPRTTLKNIGVYVQSEKKILESLRLTLGARFDKNNIYGNQITPRIGLVAPIKNNFSIKLMYGSAFRAPSVREVFSSGVGTTRITNPDLKPEKLHSFELASIYNLATKMQVELNIFYTLANDVIISNVQIEGGKTQNQNLSKMTNSGGELKVNSSISRRFNLFASISYQSGKQTILAKKKSSIYDPLVTDPDTIRKYNINIPNIAKWKGNFIFDYQVSNKVNLNFVINWVGSRTTDITNPLRSIDGYILGHLTVIADLTKRCSVSVNINNLFNTVNFDPGVRTADDISFSSEIEEPGRKIFAKFNFNF